MSFTVAIVGRPNVGKSTLFNRLAGKRLALVDAQPGLTRDRREAEATLGSCAVTLIDTAGLEPGDKGLTPRMRQQTEAAIAQADLVVFLIDARAGVVSADEIFADLVRSSGKPVILAANKWDGRSLLLFDTAGLRRKMRVEGRAEEISVGDALKAIRFAEVVVLRLDVEQPFEKQDLQIADLIEQEGRALVIAVNKWDLVREREKRLNELPETCHRLLAQIKGVPLVPVSALGGDRKSTS